MDSRLVEIKFDERLNKLASEDYANIECWQKREAVNKGQLEWVRRQIHGTNLFKEGAENSRMRVDDIQILLKNKDLNITDKGLYYESENIPEDYGWFSSVLIYGSKGSCKNELMLDVHHIEEANVNEWLSDWSKKPSFEYRQCFYTLSGNKMRVYTNEDFQINSITLVYYRLPRKFDIQDCEWYDNAPGVMVGLEFKDDVCELIIDEAVSIIAGDIEHINAYQIASKRKEENN
jgi:hypothetical protein